MLLDWLHTFNTIAWIASNVSIVYIAIVLLIFVVGYPLLFNPKATTAGKFIHRFSLSLIGVMGLVAISLFINPTGGRVWYEYPGDIFWWRPSLRLFVYGYVAVTITGLAGLLVVRKWWPEKIKTAPDRDLVQPRSNTREVPIIDSKKEKE